MIKQQQKNTKPTKDKKYLVEWIPRESAYRIVTPTMGHIIGLEEIDIFKAKKFFLA